MLYAAVLICRCLAQRELPSSPKNSTDPSFLTIAFDSSLPPFAMSPSALKGVLVAIKHRVSPPKHPWCPWPQFRDCAECRRKWEKLRKKWAEERRPGREEKLEQMITSPTVVYRMSKVLRHDKAFDEDVASDFSLSVDGQDDIGADQTDSHCYDDSSTISSMATGDNIGAGRTVYNHFYKPAGLCVENNLNRVLGPYFVSPYALGYHLRKAFTQMSTEMLRTRKWFYDFNLTCIERNLRKHEFVAFRRLICDAR